MKANKREKIAKMAIEEKIAVTLLVESMITPTISGPITIPAFKQVFRIP